MNGGGHSNGHSKLFELKSGGMNFEGVLVHK